MSIFLRLAVLEAVILGVQVFLYFGCEIFQHDFHNVKRPIDDRVPLMPWTVYIYILWFPLIALFPLGLYYSSRTVYLVYQIAIIFTYLVSTIAYLVYPTTFTREAPPEDFWGKSLKLVYFASFRGINCAPSLHCSQCYVVIVAALMCGAMMPGLRLLSILVAAGVVASTQLTKQHVMIDAVTALPVAVLGLFVGMACSGLASGLLAGWGL